MPSHQENLKTVIDACIAANPEIAAGLFAKITGFTKFEDGSDRDCEAVTDKGERIIVDPFVGCSWEYDNRASLVGEWFCDNEAFIHNDTGVWLTGENSFRLLGNSGETFRRPITLPDVLLALGKVEMEGDASGVYVSDLGIISFKYRGEKFDYHKPICKIDLRANLSGWSEQAVAALAALLKRDS